MRVFINADSGLKLKFTSLSLCWFKSNSTAGCSHCWDVDGDHHILKCVMQPASLLPPQFGPNNFSVNQDLLLFLCFGRRRLPERRFQSQQCELLSQLLSLTKSVATRGLYVPVSVVRPDLNLLYKIIHTRFFLKAGRRGKLLLRKGHIWHHKKNIFWWECKIWAY